MSDIKSDDQRVDEAIDESFPASDPPSYNMGRDDSSSASGGSAPTRGERWAQTAARALVAAIDAAAASLDRARRSLVQRVPQAGSARPANARPASG